MYAARQATALTTTGLSNNQLSLRRKATLEMIVSLVWAWPSEQVLQYISDLLFLSMAEYDDDDARVLRGVQ